MDKAKTLQRGMRSSADRIAPIKLSATLYGDVLTGSLREFFASYMSRPIEQQICLVEELAFVKHAHKAAVIIYNAACDKAGVDIDNKTVSLAGQTLLTSTQIVSSVARDAAYVARVFAGNNNIMPSEMAKQVSSIVQEVCTEQGQPQLARDIAQRLQEYVERRDREYSNNGNGKPLGITLTPDQVLQDAVAMDETVPLV